MSASPLPRRLFEHAAITCVIARSALEPWSDRTSVGPVRPICPESELPEGEELRDVRRSGLIERRSGRRSRPYSSEAPSRESRAAALPPSSGQPPSPCCCSCCCISDMEVVQDAVVAKIRREALVVRNRAESTDWLVVVATSTQWWWRTGERSKNRPSVGSVMLRHKAQGAQPQ
eukprot:COSAG01_NODE_24235_length_785_cov_219.922741_1_plen_174_part_00